MVKSKAKGKQQTLAASNFYPMLAKPKVALGKFASVPGKFWTAARPPTRRSGSCA